MLELIFSVISLQNLIWLIVLFPLLGAVINGSIALATAHRDTERFRPLVSFIGVLMPVLAFCATVICFLALKDAGGSALTGTLFKWASLQQLVIPIGLKLDQLSMVMALIITGVGSLIHLYSAGYMHHDSAYARYFAELNLFLFFMLVLVLGENMMLMFVGWEGVGLCSYLLIGFWFEDAEKAKAGMKAFIVNRIGDAGFLLGMFLIFAVMQASGADAAQGFLSFDTIAQYVGSFTPVATAICLLLFVGACGKSAQIPLYVWLPDAMAGPTAVSALIHAATMVTAGVYMIVRLNFLYVLSPTAMNVVACVGAATALFAATMGITARDIKKILAYSTVSQLGYMFLACGVGAFSGAIFHLMTHAFFKALLFLGAGSVIHALHGEQDIFKMGGLKDKLPITCWTFVIASLALAGVIPTSGFFSKDEILWHTFATGHTGLWFIGFLAAGMTAFYIFRLVGAVFFGNTRLGPEQWRKAHESPASMTIPLILLAVLSAFGGFFNVPEIFGGEAKLHHWLSGMLVTGPEAHGTHGQEVMLMVVTSLWGMKLALIGALLYAQRRGLPERLALRFKRSYQLLLNRYFVDEIYQKFIVNPLITFSKSALWKGADSVMIDGLLVQGTARSVGLWGMLTASLQNGVLQQYLLYFLLGALTVLAYVLF